MIWFLRSFIILPESPFQALSDTGNINCLNLDGNPFEVLLFNVFVVFVVVVSIVGLSTSLPHYSIGLLSLRSYVQ